MPSTWQELKIFTGNANPALAEEIIQQLGVPMGSCKVIHFSDGEIQVVINESVRGDDVFIIQPTSQPSSENLMELLVMVDAMHRASARRITAVTPFYGYARQDRKAHSRDPITAKLVANLITASGASRVMTMDLHAEQIPGFFDIPVDHFSAVPLLAQYFIDHQLDNAVVVSPDLGSVQRSQKFAERIGAQLAIIDRRRTAPYETEIKHIIGDIHGKQVILIDDMIDTAGTITQGAAALKELGAADIYACCTHAVFSGSAVDRLADAPIREIIVTNTIALPESKRIDKIKVISVAPLLAKAIDHIHKNLSVSNLFS